MNNLQRKNLTKTESVTLSFCHWGVTHIQTHRFSESDTSYKIESNNNNNNGGNKAYIIFVNSLTSESESKWEWSDYSYI